MKRYLDDEKCLIALGHVPKASSIHKFGARTGIRNDRERTVWDGDELYPWDAFDTAGVLVLTSTDTEDDEDQGGSEGDGAHRVTVEGLDENYDLVSETFITNGTSTRTGTQTFKRVFRAYVSAGNPNEGDITLSRDGVDVCKIEAGNSQTLMSIYTVPRNHTALLIKCSATSAKDKDMQVKFYGRFLNQNAFRLQHIANIFENQYIYEFGIPLALPEKTDLDVRVLGYGNDNGAHVTAAFDLILYENITDY